MSLPPSRPVRLGEPLDLARPTTNPAAITRPPVRGNIDQIAVPRVAPTRDISPREWTRIMSVPGRGIEVEVDLSAPGPSGTMFEEPIAGDPVGQPYTRNGRPLRNAGIGEPLNSNGATPTPRRGPAPVNSPSPGATVSAPQVANPGRAVNPRTPLDFGAPPRGLAAGSLAAGGALSGYGEFERSRAEGGGRLENLGAGVFGFGGATVGAYYGLQAGAGVGVATANPVVGGAVAIGASVAGQQIGGRIGSRAGRDIGRVADNFVGRFFPGWNTDREQYPNQLDPAAMGQGPETAVAQSARGGEGMTPGVLYSFRVYMTRSSGPPVTSSSTYTAGGPLLVSFGPVDGGGLQNVFVGSNPTAFISQFRNYEDGRFSQTFSPVDVTRLDGQEDPPFQPAADPVYAPNPARTAPQGNPDRPWESPANLPAPPMPYRPLPTEDAPQIWPFAEPLDLGEPRLQPEPELPTTFEPSPNLANIPSAEPAPDPIPAGRPDLSPDAAPGSNPGADLATDPDTPTQPDPLGSNLTDAPEGGGLPRTFELADGTRVTENEDGSRTIVWPYGTTQEEAIRRSTPGPVIVPVMIPVGGRQTVTTPAWNLTNDPSQRDNPFIRRQTRRISQSSSNPPRGVCRYEQQRVADIQRKATTTEEMSSNPLSGFLGLYGLGIEARTKLGQTYENTQQTKERINPEDFPISVPDQIAAPVPGTRRIQSLAELGVWIVEQLDGVVGKWPMAVPVPGVSQALAVPNMSEAIAEMFGMMISQQVTSAQILNTSSRTLAQAGSATQQAALANMIAKGNAEFLGYSAQPTAVDMPLTYSPGKDPGEGLLEESTAKIKGWQNNDDTDMKRIMQDLLHAAQIIKAVYWRKLDPRKDFKEQIDEQIRGKSDFLDEVSQPSEREADDWEQYLRDVEAGFTRLTKDRSPYGRAPQEGPKITDRTPPTTP